MHICIYSIHFMSILHIHTIYFICILCTYIIRFQATPGGSQASRNPVTPAPGHLTPSGLCGHPHKHGTHTDTYINKTKMNLLKKYFNMVCFTVPGIHSSLSIFIYLLLYLSISSRGTKEKAIIRYIKTYTILQNNLHHQPFIFLYFLHL